MQTREEGEISEGRDVVVGEVDCILVLLIVRLNLPTCLRCLADLRSQARWVADSPWLYPDSQWPGSYALYSATI